MPFRTSLRDYRVQNVLICVKNHPNCCLNAARFQHFEHNYGHGKQHLANVLLSLLLLAFLFHTVLELGCQLYQEIQLALGARRKFFNDIQALTRYIQLVSWHQLLLYMAQKLELPIPHHLSFDTS